MAELEANKSNIIAINDVLPPEMIEKILKFLIYEELYQVQQTCKRWKEIIIKGNLLKKASGK